jgi:hypothetical protein
MAIQHDERIVVQTPAARQRRLLILGIAVTSVSAAVVAYRAGGYFGLVIGLLGLVIFVPITISAVLRAMRNQPALILDADGFTDHASLTSAGYVSWRDVQQIDERPYRRRTFVMLTVTDRAAFRARQSAWHRFLLRINGRQVAADIIIPDNTVSMRPAELVKTMRRLHRAAQRRAQSGDADRRA